MSVAYADASALVKLVVAEPEGPALRDHLGRHEHVVTSVVGAVELVRVGRRVRGPAGARDAEELVAGLAVIPVTDEVRRRASVLDPPGMGALDAIHLASALAPGGVQAFYCYDRRLCDAAAATGLPVESPGA